MKYEFVDRNHTVYPEGFADELNRQIAALEEVVITDNALRELITSHTREAGVRNLDRLISRLLQKLSLYSSLPL